MISEFTNLLDKIRQLAERMHALRTENNELREMLAALTTDNVKLADRMTEAHARVAALLQSMPAAERDEEAA